MFACVSFSHTPAARGLQETSQEWLDREPGVERRVWARQEGRGAPRDPASSLPTRPLLLREERSNSSRRSETSQSTTKQTPPWEGPGPAVGGASVEEDGVGVPVGDLSHVLQDVLLGDDSQQPPVDTDGDNEVTVSFG